MLIEERLLPALRQLKARQDQELAEARRGRDGLQNELDELKAQITSSEKYDTGRLDGRLLLHRLIDHHFNMEDLRDLFFQLGVDIEDFVPGGKESYIRQLILHYGKTDGEHILATKCAELRKGVRWPFAKNGE